MEYSYIEYETNELGFITKYIAECTEFPKARYKEMLGEDGHYKLWDFKYSRLIAIDRDEHILRCANNPRGYEGFISGYYEYEDKDDFKVVDKDYFEE